MNSAPFVSHEYILNDNVIEIKRLYKLTFLQRLFVTVEDPTSCIIGQMYALLIAVATILSIAFLILDSMQDLKVQPSECAQPVCDNSYLCPGLTVCEPLSPPWFGHIQDICIYIFIADYLLRIFLCTTVPARLAGCLPNDWDDLSDQYGIGMLEEFRQQIIAREDPNYPALYHQWCYMIKLVNIIDLVAILPCLLNVSGVPVRKVFVVRVLRLAKLVRTFKYGQWNRGAAVLSVTMENSLFALFLLSFFSLIATVLFGSIMFFFEQGNFTVSAQHPHGAFLRPNVADTMETVSPFESILSSMYFVIVTMTTVGYGDIYPTTVLGRMFAVFAMYCGVFVFALPISVIGSNFEKQLVKEYGDSGNAATSSLLTLLQDFNPQRHFASHTGEVNTSAALSDALLDKAKKRSKTRGRANSVLTIMQLGPSPALSPRSSSIIKRQSLAAGPPVVHTETAGAEAIEAPQRAALMSHETRYASCWGWTTSCVASSNRAIQVKSDVEMAARDSSCWSVRCAAHKAALLSSVVVLSHLVCTEAQQEAIMGLVHRAGLQEALEDCHRAATPEPPEPLASVSHAAKTCCDLELTPASSASSAKHKVFLFPDIKNSAFTSSHTTRVSSFPASSAPLQHDRFVLKTQEDLQLMANKELSVYLNVLTARATELSARVQCCTDTSAQTRTDSGLMTSSSRISIVMDDVSSNSFHGVFCSL